MDIKSTVHMDEIPAQLIFNWDQIGINYITVSNWTMEQVGSKRVEIVGKDDKRQVTVLLDIPCQGISCHHSLFTKARLIDAYLSIHFHPAGTSPLLKIIGVTSKLHIDILLTFSYHTSHKRRWNSKWFLISVHC